MIKTYRGLLADNTQDRIRLQTIKGKVGYRIIKFQILPENPHNTNIVNHVVKLFKSSPTSVTADVNFSDSDLLGVATYTEDPGVRDMPGYGSVIFDQEIFNQDIFITNKELHNNLSSNYYLELEVIPLDDAGAEYTTLKDMRQSG